MLIFHLKFKPQIYLKWVLFYLSNIYSSSPIVFKSHKDKVTNSSTFSNVRVENKKQGGGLNSRTTLAPFESLIYPQIPLVPSCESEHIVAQAPRSSTKIIFVSAISIHRNFKRNVAFFFEVSPRYVLQSAGSCHL